MAFADVTFVTLQILTKAGVLNVPAWYAAGKVSAEQSNIDWRESPSRPSCCTALQTPACLCSQALAPVWCIVQAWQPWKLHVNGTPSAVQISPNSKQVHSPCRRTAVRAVRAVPLG